MWALFVGSFTWHLVMIGCGLACWTSTVGTERPFESGAKSVRGSERSQGPVRQRLNFRLPNRRVGAGSIEQTPKSRRWVSEADNRDQRRALCRWGRGPAMGVAAVVPLVVPAFRAWIVDVS